MFLLYLAGHWTPWVTSRRRLSILIQLVGHARYNLSWEAATFKMQCSGYVHYCSNSPACGGGLLKECFLRRKRSGWRQGMSKSLSSRFDLHSWHCGDLVLEHGRTLWVPSLYTRVERKSSRANPVRERCKFTAFSTILEHRLQPSSR